MKPDANQILRDRGAPALRDIIDVGQKYVERGEPYLSVKVDDRLPLARARPLKLTYFDDCGAFVEKRWILKGIIARGETSAWIAPPGAGKSALLTEISVHCAAQRDWRGHRAKEASGVVIFALERAGLFNRRLMVYKQTDGLPGLPIA